MAEQLLDLELEEQAEIAFSSLRPEDRRQVEAWFDHLRNWHNDEFIRSRSRRLRADEEIYVTETSAGLLIAFRIAGNQVVVLAIFRKESLRTFEALAGRNGG